MHRLHGSSLWSSPLLPAPPKRKRTEPPETKSAPSPADVKIAVEEVAAHASGPDDASSGGLAPKPEVKPVAPSMDLALDDAEADTLSRDLNVGLSEDSLKVLSGPVAALFRKPDVSTEDRSKVTLAYQYEEGRTLRSRLHSRVTHNAPKVLPQLSPGT